MENENNEPFYKVIDDEKEIILSNINIDSEGRKFVYELCVNGTTKHYTDIDKLLGYIKRNIDLIPYCSIRMFYFENCIKFYIDRRVKRKEITKEDFQY